MHSPCNTNKDKDMDMVHISVRVPARLKKMMEEHVRRETYKDLSEFVREAVRSKIREEAPALYQDQDQEEGG